MFFTREDILKIQNALLQLSVKDSELPSAEPVTYDDTLSIVQDGKNKQIKIEDFFNQISLWKREDFINITDKYDEHYISLIEAIDLVPILQRKDGLVITFQDIEGNWEIYQFRGNITEFFNIEKWFNLYDYRNNIIQSIVPDEEDLTASIPNENGNSLVSLKDRVYDPTSFSGKGYKILRKNIQSVNIAVTKIKVEFSPSSDGTLSFSINGKETQVAVSATTDNTTALVAQKVAVALQDSMTEYDVSIDVSLITLTRKFGGSVTPSLFSASTTGVVCTVTDSSKRESRNILTKDMITKSNTIYEIRYDFDLNGETIEMQEGCTLKFNGGSFRNGSLVGNNTNIKYVKGNVLFKENLNIAGKWNVPYITSSMFEDLSSDNEIKKLISLTDESIYNTVIIEHGTYNVSVKSQLDYAIGLNSNTRFILHGTISLAPNNFESYDVLKISDSSNVVVEGTGSIIGDKSTHTGTTGEWGVGVEILNSKNIKIDGINILNCWGDCVYVGDDSKQICLSNLNIDNGRRQGISIVSVDNIVVENCIIRNISGTAPEYGIDIEPNKEQSIDNVSINNIKFYSCKGGILSYGGADNVFIGNVKISNCSFDNVYEKNTISLHGVNNASIINCNIIANTCISVQSCNTVAIENCYLDSRKVDGIGTDRTIFSTKNKVVSILNNIILSNGVAIRDSSNTLIEHNDITCLKLFDGFPANINNTKIINNNISGYLSGQLTNCTINNNIIKAGSSVNRIESSVINNNKFLGTMTISLLKDTKICNNIFSGIVKTDDTDRNPVNLYCGTIENSIINGNYFNNGNIESTIKNCIISSNILKYDSGECLRCNSDSINVIIDNNIICYIGTSEQLNMINLISTTFSIIMNNLLDPNSLVKYAVQFSNNESTNDIVRNNRLISPCKVGGRPFGPINDGCIVESADYATKGSTLKRPIIEPFSKTLNDGDTAYPYFDTTLNKIMYWTGYKWVDSQGENPDNNNSGSSENRPTSANIGFMYFDTTLHKPIYYNGNGWVDATGASV